MRLVLASASPRRVALMTAAGFEFDTCPADVDERPRPDDDPRRYVRRLASEKSAQVLARLLADGGTSRAADPLIVVGADTAVVVDGEILGKPASAAEAEGMLRRLSGRAHEVLTGVSLRTPADELAEVEVTTVWFVPLTTTEVGWYVASGEGRDKAGAYGIQGRASRFVTRIDGSYSNVVGLPVATVHRLIQQLETRTRGGCVP
jgi:septum formation protein